MWAPSGCTVRPRGRSRSSRSRPKARTWSAEWRTRHGTSTVEVRRTSTTGDIRQDTGRSIFGWIKSRFPTVPYADLTRVVVETDQRQLPRSHAEKYELKTIWYWYPLYCLGGIAFVAFVILTITGILLGFFYVPDGRLEINPTTQNLTNPAWNSMLVIMNEIRSDSSSAGCTTGRRPS